MEAVKEGHLDLLSGPLLGYQRKYFVVDAVNGFVAYAASKSKLFKVGSETIPACTISGVEIWEAEGNETSRSFVVTLKNGRKLQLRVERSDSAEQWVSAISELMTLKGNTSEPLSASGAGGNIRISWKTLSDPGPKGDYELTQESLTGETSAPLEGITAKEYELLCVACDPIFLKDVMRMSPVEQEIFGSQKSFTFRTQVVEVNSAHVPKTNVKGRVMPSVLSKMAGGMHAYRNESIKQFGENLPKKLTGNMFVTTYQLLGPGETKTDDELKEHLVQDIQTVDWFPYKEHILHESLLTKYFPHFSNEDLVRGLPWKLLDIQGEHRTLYISSSACFESVLHVWEYHNLLFTLPKVKNALPKNKAAPIGIVGAGPAGLLMAVRLTRLGYTNIEFIEASERYAGKSLSLTKDSAMGEIICELGTCYLSADYATLRAWLSEYMQDLTPVPSTVDRQFVADKYLRVKEGLKKVDSFENYTLAVGMEEEHAPGFKILTRIEVLYDFYQYSQLHEKIFGGQLPFPVKQPIELRGALGKQTFYEFLKINGFESIIGILQYSYQAQGYGALETIPAFYGLIWITPTLLHSMFLDAVEGTLFPLTYKSNTITYITKGWTSVWDNIMKKHNYPINYNSRITVIDRPFGI